MPGEELVEGLGRLQSMEDTLTRYRRVLGDDHPATLTSANNLANNLSALGEHEQAREPDEWIKPRYRS